jgi:cytochrome c2
MVSEQGTNQMGRLTRAVLSLIVLTVAAPGRAQEALPERLETSGMVAADGLHVIGPPLTALRTKIADPNWLVAWLLRPAQLRRHARMRHFHVTTAQAQALAKFLYAGASPVRGPVRWQGGDARIGETLFVTRGCRGCHAIDATQAPAMPRVPHLAGIGIKVRGDWLFNWLKSPRAYNPDTAMPQLVLSDDDIRHLVAFLLSHREGAAVVAAAPRFNPRVAADAALPLIDRFDCAKCHLITGFQWVQPANDWSFVPHACTGCHEPASTPSRSPVAADRDPTAMALHDGRLLAAFYNCRGCHRIEGSGGTIAAFLERQTFAPPTLDGEGARVQTSWLVDFLQHPKSLRPWLQIRMPDFGLSETEATVLAKYFAALAHVVPADETLNRAADEIAAFGQRRFAHFKCRQCHPARTAARLPAGVDPEDLSIDLALAKTRLRPSWIRDFLARPKAVVGTETRMPTVFYTTDGVPKVDDPEHDIAAITTYLQQLTDAAVIDHSQPPPPIDWSSAPY